MSWKSYFVILFLFISSIMGLRLFIITPYKVVTDSLKPVLLSGDFVFANRVNSTTRNYERGDFIIYRDSRTENGSLDVARIIAKPGDYVENRESQIYINERELGVLSNLEPFKAFIIAPEEYSILKTTGNSERMITISKSQIHGKVFMIWFSVDQLERISEPSWTKIRWKRIGSL
jgi:signal peptidase I